MHPRRHPATLTERGPQLAALRVLPRWAGILAAAGLAACGGGGGSTGGDATSGGGTGAGNDCMNFTLAATAGTKTVVVLEGTSAGQAGKVSNTYDWTVLGPATFEGQSRTATQSTVTIQALGSGAVTTQSTTDYALIDVNSQTITQYGWDSSIKVGNATISTRFVANPPTVLQKWTLLAGQSTTASWQGTSTTGAASGPLSGSATDRFVGPETITVPAGTYETCRYESVQAAQPNVTITYWYVKGTAAAFARMDSVSPTSSTRLEATSITVNGKKV